MLPCSWKMEDTTPTEDVPLGHITSNKYGSLSEHISSSLGPRSRVSHWLLMLPQHFCTDNGLVDPRETITETRIVPSEKSSTQYCHDRDLP